ncbi:MAG: HU family DNA-binding protein [Deltaproteobacteria bacterium]|nr:HU family DNA-binding protein [Deltaproteobacteria bacterium]MBW2306234.1 HU family DNA-binding protein [Deltaproteobacteria bacterium]
MNKAELVAQMSKKAGIPKVAASKALNSITEGVKGSLKKGKSVSMLGFGSFSVVKRAARTVRNPRTGKPMKIKATKAVRFRPGKNLKAAVKK